MNKYRALNEPDLSVAAGLVQVHLAALILVGLQHGQQRRGEVAAGLILDDLLQVSLVLWGRREGASGRQGSRQNRMFCFFLLITIIKSQKLYHFYFCFISAFQNLHFLTYFYQSIFFQFFFFYKSINTFT